MEYMFYKCSEFNQPLNNWDTSQVTNMEYMFYECSEFNQLLNNWNTSQVTNMNHMFYKCTEFNQPLNNWDTLKVTNMNCMFYKCTEFNQLLNNWNVTNVTNMDSIFNNCIKFNQPLNNWDTSSVTTMKHMFSNCVKFNQSLNNWNVFTYVDISDVFYNCCNFNQPLIMWHCAIYNQSDYMLLDALDDLIKNPYTYVQKNTIINNIMNTSIINSIVDNYEEIIVPKYKNIFKGYDMPYKVVNYNILCRLEHLGIKISDAIDYNRFTNDLLVDLHINKKNTFVHTLINYIEKTDAVRYNCLVENLKKLFNERLNKNVDLIIYNNNILFTEK